MSADDNKQAAKEGYEAFGKGDAEGAMANISDSIVWVVGGDNALTGTYNGKQEVAGVWGQLAEKGFQTQPTEFLADGDKVAVLATTSVGGEEAENVDVATYDGSGQMVRFETFGGETVLDRAFPK
ncbi:MAG: nuclear transport factor 2 family protein [Solirubrobacterales bacterium]